MWLRSIYWLLTYIKFQTTGSSRQGQDPSAPWGRTSSWDSMRTPDSVLFPKGKKEDVKLKCSNKKKHCILLGWEDCRGTDWSVPIILFIVAWKEMFKSGEKHTLLPHKTLYLEVFFLGSLCTIHCPSSYQTLYHIYISSVVISTMILQTCSYAYVLSPNRVS